MIKPKRLGIKMKPPSLVLLYEEGDGKVRKCTMPTRDLASDSFARKVTVDLVERHNKYLGEVPLVRVERLVRVLQEVLRGRTLQESLDLVQKEFTVDPEEDLNKVDDETLQRKKDVMEELFEVNRKKPSDPDYKYDFQVDFEQDGPIETSGWDSENDQFEF